MNNINILLLASEITKGMKSIGPKCLLKLNNEKSVIDYQIQKAKSRYPNAHISVLTGFESDRVKKHIANNRYRSINIVYDKNYSLYNQTHAILTAIENLDNISNLLIIGSGVLFKQYPAIKSSSNSTIFYLDQPKDNFSIGTLDMIDQYLFYGLPNIWSECVFFGSDAIKELSSLNKNMFKQLYLFETINQLIERKISFDNKVVQKNQVFKVASHKDLIRAKRFSLV
jgi:NDP-sugar pyrophosphorylase family protein